MNNKEYIEAAHRTLSPEFHGHLVHKLRLENSLYIAINAISELDKIKKALFYGKDVFAEDNYFQDCLGLKPQADLVHGIIGKATEAGELLEALLTGLKSGVFDLVNVSEEIGDGMWYDAILLKAIGSDITTEQERNIAKLKARFPEKFTAQAANNRDLETERKILEK